MAHHRGARRHRRAAHAGGRGVRRPVRARPHLLPDGLRRRLVADGPDRRLAGAVRHRPRGARRASRTSSSRASRCCRRSTGRRRASGPRPARRLPRAPGRPLDGVPRADQGPRARPASTSPPAWLRDAPADRLHPRAHARRLPVRQRDVPPRRAGAAGRDRRLGDGHRRRPEARPRRGWCRAGPRTPTRREAVRVGLRRHARHAVARPRCSPTTPRCPAARSTTSTTT